MPTAPPVHRSAGWKPKATWVKAPDSDRRKLTGRPWRRIRDRVMDRDKWLCQQCLEVGVITAATECDHIIPVAKGGSDAENNLQALCHRCHTMKTVREVGGPASTHPDWLPKPVCPVVVVTGPPGGGKSTYCRTHAQHSDVVIDLDDCFKDMCGVHGHEADREHLWAAIRWRNKQLAELARKTNGIAYFIVSSPTRAETDWWLSKLNASHVRCDPGITVCVTRLEGQRRVAAEAWYEAAQRDDWRRKENVPRSCV